MFSQASQLNAESLSAADQSAPVSQLVEKALAEAKSLQVAVESLPAAAKTSDQRLGEVAALVAYAAEREAAAVVSAAARLDSKADQQAVLAAAKDLVVQSQVRFSPLFISLFFYF